MECTLYAAEAKLYFLGGSTEPREYPGCVVWGGAHAEYNRHLDERGGCNLGDRGACVCYKLNA